MKMNKSMQKKIAQEQISYLIIQAKEMFPKNSVLANRYIARALKMRDKYKVQLTRDEKKQVCKECHHILIQGKNAKIRVKKSMLLIHCTDCGAIRRLALK